MGIAERSGLIAPQLCKMLLTTVALSMAATPMLAETGSLISKKIEEERGSDTAAIDHSAVKHFVAYYCSVGLDKLYLLHICWRKILTISFDIVSFSIPTLTRPFILFRTLPIPLIVQVSPITWARTLTPRR